MAAVSAAAIKATLGLDTGPLAKGLNDARKQVGGFSTSLRALRFSAGGLFATLGIGAAIRGFKDITGWAQELNPALKKSAEEMAALNQQAAGLTDDQLERLNNLNSKWDAGIARIKGYIVALGLATVKTTELTEEQAKNIAEGGTGGFFERFKKAFNQEKPDTERAKADIEARKAEALRTKALEEHDKREGLIADAKFRQLDLAKQIEEVERKIAVAKAQQTDPDELKQAQAQTEEARQQLKLEELKAEQIKRRADEIQSGPDAAREGRRAAAERGRAERRAAREIELEGRGGLSKTDFERKQRLKGVPIGELQGPPVPAKDATASEATLKTAVEHLSKIAANLGVNV